MQRKARRQANEGQEVYKDRQKGIQMKARRYAKKGQKA